MMLVDATNAFNSLNHQVALRNIMTLCPTLATILINTYRVNIDLCIDGESILSQEGVTQGGPLSIAMYAISTIPLIRQLSQENIGKLMMPQHVADYRAFRCGGTN